MFTQKKLAGLLAIVMIATLILSACTQPTPERIEVPVTVTVEVPGETVIVTVEAPTVEAPRVDRQGAWLDTIIVVEEPSADQAVNRMQVGEIDLYAFSVSNPAVAATVAEAPELDSTRSFGS